MKKGEKKTMLTVKSTININKENKQQLDYLVKTKQVSSFTEGVNLAIESFIKEKNKEIYAQQMACAKKDEQFIKRTMKSQNDFDKIDEVSWEW